ncbi:TRAP transporter fused permease subunit, partial [Candidatus Aerophobetes bacterium]|nr:TRAP transporter fused permease subunit [Candidatus Aerophobetes bacterium]
VGMGVAAVAISMSIFQFYTAGISPITAFLQRSIHLGLGVALAFLYVPFLKRFPKDRLPWYDIVLATLGMGAFAYKVVFYHELVYRVGAPNTVDLVVGVIAIIFILEATRRAIGPALPVVVIGFLIYAFLGPIFPGLLMHKGYSFYRLVNHLYMTQQGIFGIPIGVSSTFVFVFVLFGTVLQRTGGAKYFIDIAFSLMGKYRGGPAKSAVLASGAMGLVSGSSVANAVTTGAFTIPLMKKVGLSAEKAAAVEVAASTNGQLMPPVMGAAAFVMAEFLGIPYVKVIKAAFIPAILSYIGLMFAVHLEAVKLNLRGLSKEELPRFIATFFGGIHFLIPLGVLLYLLVIKFYTPMTAAFAAVASTMILHIVASTWFGLRGKPNPYVIRQTSSERPARLARLVLADFLGAFEAAAKNMIGIIAACACAGIIIGVTTLTGLGLNVTHIILDVAGNNLYLTLLLTMLAALVLGMGLPTTATYIIVVVLLAPAIVTAGPSIPLIAAHLFIFYFGIVADDTPPVGVAAYAAAGVANSDPFRTCIEGFKLDFRIIILPFIYVFSPQLLLINTTVWEVLLICGMAILGMFALS